jgi:hypothetical protein
MQAILTKYLPAMNRQAQERIPFDERIDVECIYCSNCGALAAVNYKSK